MIKKCLIFLILCVPCFSANYYIDYTNGIDSATGLKQGNFTSDVGTTTTTIIDTELNGLTITDNAASSGDFVWNVTRGAGSFVDSWTDATDTIVLTGAIAGQTNGDTYYILSSWKTINQYTTTTVRSAGDIAYVRANQTHTQNAADIVFDEDGTLDSYISIIGCDATTNDPWNDDSDVKSIIDFADSAYGFAIIGDDYWWIERLDIRQSADGIGMMYLTATGTYLKSCDFSDSVNKANIYFAACINVIVDSCTFKDCGIPLLNMTAQTYVTFKNCTFDAGSVRGATYAITITYGTCFFDSCSFAPSNIFTTACFNLPTAGTRVYLRNCAYSGTLTGTFPGGSYIFSEDDDGTFESQSITTYMGVITRGTASPRAGGADSFATMTPNANCGLYYPLILGMESGFAKVWLTASVQKTITVYARTGSAWDSALTAGEAYLKCSYLSNGASAARTEVNSTEQITNDAAWTAFTVTITPSRTGFAYLWFYLAEYEDATEYVDVDIKPVIS